MFGAYFKTCDWQGPRAANIFVKISNVNISPKTFALRSRGNREREREQPSCLEKAKKMKRPAAPVKRPAANTSTASSKATTWQPSDSFGFLKCTKATEKSYIQAKPDLSAKPYCLVNVQGSGVDHAAVVDQLMEYAKQAGLDKAKVVKEKISLLAPEVD